MAINRKFWESSFQQGNLPKWICPTCSEGTLMAKNNEVILLEDASTLKSKDHDFFEIDWIKGPFYGILNCNNSECKEVVTVVGSHQFEVEPDLDDPYDYSHVQVISPLFFYPTISLFKINENVSQEIREIVYESFSLYWSDVSSCANKIRMAIEKIMDDQKIKKSYIFKGKRKLLSLHSRIEHFKDLKPKEGELLMALKWIGNFGSHSNDNLTREDILDAFDILDYVTNKLYEKDSKRILRLGKRINKLKGPQKKSSKKK